MEENNLFDLIIIGAGPAGLTAAIYGARGGLKTLVFGGPTPGGQLLQTSDVENFPGFENPINGFDLMNRMINQAKRVGANIRSDQVVDLDLSQRPFKVKTSNKEFLAKTLIIATGASAKWLGLESEEKFKGKGVSACATCDGFFFKDKTVCVIGGGDTACEEASFLTKFAKKVYLIHRRDKLRATYVMQQKVKNNEKIEIIYDHIPVEITGEEKVNGIIIKNVKSGETRKLDLEGVFIAIGHHPNTDILKDKLRLDDYGYIIVDKNLQTSVEGVYAAGDVCDPVYKQAVVAAGMGAMAAINAFHFIESNP